ncbi:MAG: S23 ribosomal protein [Candidatus Moranbacteria bacterium GW2011_GWF2_34_56]|nr:MAG: S23 ribosomal protein [Candidatus Moranbacteria bacterium GW2011_GWF1_34_10]KKP63995.1 MAG: S23 ribosomal protein [Candidatus Moranbacteria bacterium GW2011_GWF2_34_56]HBI17363.1 four helix bundle protein [Candidatus Moranbacteria bacterium]
MQSGDFKNQLKIKMDNYVHFVYKITKEFPKEELYGTTSQFRRATLSIILNYIEGYARKRPAVQLNFFEISYGSLKESKYLLYFSLGENFIDKTQHDIGMKMSDEIGAMLWTEIRNLEKRCKSNN